MKDKALGEHVLRAGRVFVDSEGGSDSGSSGRGPDRGRVLGWALLVAIGVTVLINAEHRRDRDALRDVLDAVRDLDDRVEARPGKLEGRLAGPATDGAPVPRRRPIAADQQKRST